MFIGCEFIVKALKLKIKAFSKILIFGSPFKKSSYLEALLGSFKKL
jgi:hypothetical protein